EQPLGPVLGVDRDAIARLDAQLEQAEADARGLAGVVLPRPLGPAAEPLVAERDVVGSRGGVLEEEAGERLVQPFPPVPRYAAITASSACTSAGVPSEITLPKSRASTRSARSITSPMSCSTSRIVSPSSWPISTM